MITKTLNLDDAYTKLFDEIRTKSEGAIDINTVEGFFGNIIEITALDKKFLRLPLDEPMFAIDANSRKITVPDEFKSNGISVQGDHLAETVYFVIDRYFDYMDLNNTEITINWKMGTESGKTDRFTKSPDVIPGCIVFGWPINNIVTAKSGTLTFAVEFSIKNGEGEVLYDFNTLTASVNIKDGLVVSDVEVVNLDNDILAALSNSQFTLPGEVAVGDVTWLTGEGHGLVANLSSENGKFIAAPFSSAINLNTTVNEQGVPSSIPMNLYAQGYVDAGSDVQYFDMNGQSCEIKMFSIDRELEAVENNSELENNIKYFVADGSVATEENINAWDTDEAIPLFKSAALPQNVKYYVLAGEENPPAYSLASNEQIEAWGTTNEVALFIKLAEMPITVANSYVIKAQGERWSNDVKVGAGSIAISDIVIVPEPEAPSSIIIEASNQIDLENPPAGYSFAEDLSNVIFLTGENDTLTAHAVGDNLGALQFVWKKKDGVDRNGEDKFVNVSQNNVPYKNVNEDVFEVEESGDYVVDVYNFLNGEVSTEAKRSAKIAASPLAGKIESATLKYKKNSDNTFISVLADNTTISFDSSVLSKNLTLMIDDIDIDGEIGTLKYEWYQKESKEANEQILVHEDQSFQVGPGDFYYVPVLKNVLNGSIYTYELPGINVNDQSV